MVFGGVRDITATGTEEFADELVGEPIEAHAAAERALAKVAALRTLCFAVGGWLPLLILLAAGPWLVGRGVSTGTLLGGLTYVLIGLQPALNTVMSALGDSGLRYVITLGRILDSAAPAERPRRVGESYSGYQVRLRGLTFAYGPERRAGARQPRSHGAPKASTSRWSGRAGSASRRWPDSSAGCSRRRADVCSWAAYRRLS